MTHLRGTPGIDAQRAAIVADLIDQDSAGSPTGNTTP